MKQAIWDAAKETITDWTQAKLHTSSLYGIRIYTRGSVLSSHVDRLPLVSSAIICVDADVEEPWPLEVIGHDGKAHNVTMEPGDMVLCKWLTKEFRSTVAGTNAAARVTYRLTHFLAFFK